MLSAYASLTDAAAERGGLGTVLFDLLSLLELTRWAMAAMRCENDLRIVPDATRMFEEPGALEMVAAHARDWFPTHVWS